MIGKREISEDEAASFAKKNSLDYIECSAFNSLNISLVFEAIVKKVLRERTKREKKEPETPLGGATSKTNLTGTDFNKKNKSSCC